MSEAGIRGHLMKLDHVRTVVQGVRNDILRVEARAVQVRSERTNRKRWIPYSRIERWDQGRWNSCVGRALARATGLAGA